MHKPRRLHYPRPTEPVMVFAINQQCVFDLIIFDLVVDLMIFDLMIFDLVGQLAKWNKKTR